MTSYLFINHLFICKEDCHLKPTTWFSAYSVGFSAGMSRMRKTLTWGEWTVTDQVLSSQSHNRDACWSKGCQEPRVLQESSAQPRRCCFKTHRQRPRLSGLIKVQREEWRRQLRPETPTKTVVEVGGLPRYSHNRDQKARSLFGHWEMSPTLSQGQRASASAKVSPRLLVILTQFTGKKTTKEAIIPFQCSLMDLLQPLAAKVIFMATSVRSTYSPRHAHFYLNYNNSLFIWLTCSKWERKFI